MIFSNEEISILWLKETHLKNMVPVGCPDFQSFHLQGNEDCPTKIELYAEANPEIGTKPILTITPFLKPDQE